MAWPETKSKWSGDKLFHRDAIIERMFGIEQQSQRTVAIQRDFDRCNIADFALVCDRTDRAFAAFQNREFDDIAIGQDRAFPAARAERTDGRQGQQ